MKRLRLLIENMEPLDFIHEASAFTSDVKKLWREQMGIACIKRYNQFAPLEQVLKATDFVIVNTEQNQRDKILIYGAIQEALERKDKVIIPLCYFNEERFTLL